MPNKMLIDASHPEETRVVVLRGNRVEEFDFESASRKQLRGNIYLAKVTRVEPSLQAAFIEYGGNKHGFLAFSEIHPDYYQIPVADRQALLAEEAMSEEEDEEEERRPRRSRRRRRDAPSERRRTPADASVAEAAPDAQGEIAHYDPSVAGPAAHESGDVGYDPSIAGPAVPDESGAGDFTSDGVSNDREHASGALGSEIPEQQVVAYPPETTAAVEASLAGLGEAPAPGEIGSPHASEAPFGAASEPHEEATAGAVESEQVEFASADLAFAEPAPTEGSDEDDEDEDDEEEEHVEQIGGDALEEMPRRKPRVRRHYKIQEVIKRRQILLVQVVKEERGNKGAALTTYLSLAGRYSVLMPNTARGGGISRKITDNSDRKRLKSIVQDLEVPEGMGVILRTAGAARTRPEVKRDFEYLLRMWENVRELTLQSSAPSLVYEEGSLIKRTIRDLYSKDIEEVLVAGDTAWREAKDFMRLIMPNQARNVVPWRDPQPIFVRSGVEAQLDAMFSNHVTLRSGGYLVINQTEALVAIDVNSGRSTREHNIEDTALRTNLEASDEVARQLRLRDLAGLIVVDFIDMEEGRNNRAVERRVKEALKNDRARIQVGRISHFGLLEMSRQRIRTGVLEGSTAPCPHCAGSGMVRSVSSVALHVLRVLEDALTKSATHDPIVRTRTEVALYILNHKRAHLGSIERRFGVHVTVEADDAMTGQIYHALERGELASGVPEPFVPLAWEPDPEDEVFEPDAVEDEFGAQAEPAEGDAETHAVADGGALAGDTAGSDEAGEEREGEGEEAGRRRRRRRRRGRGRGERENGAAPGADLAPEADAETSDDAFAPVANPDAMVASGSDGYWAREATGAPVPFHAAREDESGTSAERSTDEGAAVIQPLDHQPPVPTPAGASMEHYAVADLPTADAAPRDMEPLPEPTRSEQAMATSAPASRESPTTEPPEPALVLPPREPTEVVITRADPQAPKRGGWWSRAKATLSGEP